MKRGKLSLLYAATALALLAAGAVSLLPRPLEAAIYQAGILRPGTMICKCPVLTGDCVCEWTTE